METLITFLIILAVCAVIAIVAYVIYRLLHPKMKQDKPTDEQKKEFLQEELDRVLVPVEDENLAKEISEYKDDEDE